MKKRKNRRQIHKNGFQCFFLLYEFHWTFHCTLLVFTIDLLYASLFFIPSHIDKDIQRCTLGFFFVCAAIYIDFVMHGSKMKCKRIAWGDRTPNRRKYRRNTKKNSVELVFFFGVRSHKIDEVNRLNQRKICWR